MEITEFLQAIVALAAAGVAAFLIPFLKKKLTAEKLAGLRTWVDVAVLAAEQLIGSKQGQAKKQFVLNFLQRKGYTVNSDEVDKIIESAVYKLTNSFFKTAEKTQNAEITDTKAEDTAEAEEAAEITEG